MKIFDTEPKSGSPVRQKKFFTAMLRMARAWENLAVHNGSVQWSDGMPTIVVDGVGGSSASMPFSGRVWIGQLSKITIDTAEAGATKFLYLKFAGTHTWAESMPDQQPADGQVYDLDQTAGDIHMPGNFAG